LNRECASLITKTPAATIAPVRIGIVLRLAVSTIQLASSSDVLCRRPLAPRRSDVLRFIIEALRRNREAFGRNGLADEG
jgi:hypothetical protein